MSGFYIKIYGLVQGIGYRWFVLEKAQKYNICGWVKNLDDGSVECVAKGNNEDLEKFINEIITMHPLAKIEKIIKEECDIKIEQPSFIIKR